MAINKFQISLISLINAISSIYSWVCVSEYGIIYKSFSTNDSLIWLSVVLMGVIAALTSIYFILMCLYGIACSCLTGDTSAEKAKFSMCGCISMVIAISVYAWAWYLYTEFSSNAKTIIVQSYPLIWKAYMVLLFNPVAIIGLIILFFIYRNFCKNTNEDDSKDRLIDENENRNRRVIYENV